MIMKQMSKKTVRGRRMTLHSVTVSDIEVEFTPAPTSSSTTDLKYGRNVVGSVKLLEKIEKSDEYLLGWSAAQCQVKTKSYQSF